jgi:Endonuclease/Exonuclease/phosphatase family
MHARGIVAVAAGLTLTAAGFGSVDPVAGSGSRSAALATASPRATAGDPSVEISVLSQNIMYGGDDYDLQTGDYCAVTDGCPQSLRKLARIVRASGADIAGIQEPEHNAARLARMLGGSYSSAAHVISRFRVIDPPRAHGLFVFVVVAPGKVVAVSNVHLISSPYGPDAVRDGATRRQVLRLERQTRMRDIQPQLKLLPRLVDRGFPTILTGDFNTPSQLDWTAAVAQARPDVVKYPIRWPVGRALAGAGLVDSYREIYPDPVAKPAFTWTPGGPEGVDGQIMDRIDWILHGGPVTTLDSQIVGEKGGPDVDLGFRPPYPTDHRGVLSTFAVQPRALPVLASTRPVPLTAGGAVPVAYRLPTAGGRVQLLDAGGRGAGRVVRTLRTPDRLGYGARLRLGANLRGRFLLVARSASGQIVSRQALWVYRRGEAPTLSTPRTSYRVGQPITAHWTRAPGMGLDWVGLIPCRRHGPCIDGNYARYSYTKSRVQGTLRIGPHFGPMEGTEPWPVKPGRYVLRVFVDDSYVAIAQSRRFTVHR